MDIDKIAADIAASVEQEPTDWTCKLIRFGIEAGLEQAAVIALSQQYGNIAHDAETECHDASCQQIAAAIRSAKP